MTESLGATTAGAWANEALQGTYSSRGQSVLIPLQPYNFGDYQAGSIYGTVYNDLNQDAVQEDGEPGLSTWTVQLLNSGGQVIATTLSNAQGDYAFSNLLPGTYSVQEVLQSGWTETTQALQTVTVQGGKDYRFDFGNTQAGDWVLQAKAAGPRPVPGILAADRRGPGRPQCRRL